jgi:hypothetical protein
MPDEFITRSEYTARHDELVSRIVKVEALFEAYRDNVSVRFDKLTDKIDSTQTLLSGQIGNIKEEIYRQRNGNLKYMLSVLTSFLLGGGLLELITYLHGVIH